MTLSMIPWQPCILKQPWGYNSLNATKSALTVAERGPVSAAKPVLMFDKITSNIVEFSSPRLCGESIGKTVQHIRISAKIGSMILERYIVAYTISELFDNMANRGLA
jgi:hypothetical protein